MRFSHALWRGMMIMLSVCPAKTFGQQPIGPDTLQILDLSTLLAGLATNNLLLRAARQG